MNILVINGSPKGESSITLQTVLYLQKCFPRHQFSFLHVGQQIRAIEKDFASAKEALERAELILFAYPVYTFIAPSQLHRFIELMKESGVALAGKYATQVTTSKHFYDVTAHRYIQENCQDMGIKFVKGLSADMEDLLCSRGRKEAAAFFRYVLWCMKEDSYEPCQDPTGEAAHRPVQVPEKEKIKVRQKRNVVIVTDALETDTQLNAMIARFRAVSLFESRVVNIREYPFLGGCLGCLRCAASGKCIYKDGFDDFLRDEIQSADAVVYAFSIRDHSMGAVFKRYDDRQFCNGHRTVTMGSPVGYLISGDYSKEENLRMILEGRSQVGGNFLAGVATDEADPNGSIDRLSRTLSYALHCHYTQPRNFYGVGGMKIFRDLIFLMQGMMQADHQFFKEHGQYDFPQKHLGTIFKMYLVGTLLSAPAIQKKMGSKMTEGMLAPYRKALGQGRRPEK
ncbi:MAG: NAD(P)H-dependent oxidoreductase [Ruminococcus flavefaciens]|nr:NAD(P)H-dependent oxidoreductase [Ruminococcus flavefaciens]